MIYLLDCFKVTQLLTPHGDTEQASTRPRDVIRRSFRGILIRSSCCNYPSAVFGATISDFFAYLRLTGGGFNVI